MAAPSGSGRWLGGPDSWRRIAVTGIVAGVVLAFVAAMVALVIQGGGGSLDDGDSTPVFFPTAGDPLPTVPPAPTATESLVEPTEPIATEVPPTEPAAPTETPPPVATDTPVVIEPTETVPPLAPEPTAP